MAMQDLFNNLTDEQKEKFKACKTQKELMKALDEESVELSPDQLEAVSGGSFWDDLGDAVRECPDYCASDS